MPWSSYRRLILIALTFTLLAGCDLFDRTETYRVETESSPPEGGTTSPASEEFDEGSEVTVQASPAEEYRFDRWQGDLSSTQNPFSFNIEDDTQLTAVFELREYPLSIEIDGGGQVQEEVIEQLADTEYEHGTVVELTAEADEGWSFSHWEGDLQGEENPQSVTVDRERQVTAVFEREFHDLSLTVEGDGEIETEIVEQPSDSYPHETVLELTAEPADGWDFQNWEGDLDGSENPATITLTGPTEITARFLQIECDTPEQINLQPGEVMVHEFPDPCGLLLPDESGAVYRVGVMARGIEFADFGSRNSALIPTGLEIRTHTEDTGTEPLLAAHHHDTSPSLQGSGSFETDPDLQELMRRTAKVHAELHHQERAWLESRPSMPPARPASATTELLSDPPEPEQERSFYINDPNDSGRIEVEAELRVNGENIIYYQATEVTDTPEEVSTDLIEDLLEYYDQHGKPVIDDAFGGLGPDGVTDVFDGGARDADDIDGNGKLIVLQIPNDKMIDGAAGYVSSLDRYPRPENANPDVTSPVYEQSNEAEITFIQSPADNPDFFRGLLVHETKHISSHGYAIYGARGFHESWIEEGTAEIASEFSSRLASGYTLDERLDFDDIWPRTPESEAMFVMNTNALTFLDRFTDGSLIGLAQDSDNISLYYGASWLFHRYLTDSYADGDIEALFRKMNTDGSGTAVIEAATGISLEKLLSEWKTAILVDDSAVRTGSPHRYSSYNFKDIDDHFGGASGSWPFLREASLYEGQTFSYDPIHHTTPALFEFTAPGGKKMTLNVSGTDGQALNESSDVAVTVIRIE